MIIINPEDIVRIITAFPTETSNARLYFKTAKNKNTTQLAVSDIKSTVGNVPVIKRGGVGFRPKMEADVLHIEPQPVEIDDMFSAVESDDYERATAMGKQQLIDDRLTRWGRLIQNTTKALCVQAHKGKIDYMMQAGPNLVRYEVDYGDVKSISASKKASELALADLIDSFEQLAEVPAANGIGGEVEFIAAKNVYKFIVSLAANQTKFPVTTGVGFIDIGGYKVLRDNDSYTDVNTSGTSVTKHMLADSELLVRAVNAGQELDFLRIDDTVQREATPLYAFTTERDDHRGTNLYVKSKPFPLINTKGIALMKFKAE